MNELIKYKTALISIAVLTLFKFMWVPLWDTKQASIIELEEISNQKAKTIALLSLTADMDKKHNEMKRILSEISQQISTTSNLTQFKLTTQKKLTELFTEYNIDVMSLAWRNGIEKNQMKQLYIDLSVKGKTKSFLSISTYINKKIKQIELNHMQLNIRNQSDTSLGTVRGRITWELYVKVENLEGIK